MLLILLTSLLFCIDLTMTSRVSVTSRVLCVKDAVVEHDM